MEGKYSEFLSLLGGRKFVFSLAAGITAVALFAADQLTEPGFIDLAKWVGVAYLGANAFGKVSYATGVKVFGDDGAGDE